jgi:hypothetical protein
VVPNFAVRPGVAGFEDSGDYHDQGDGVKIKIQTDLEGNIL